MTDPHAGDKEPKRKSLRHDLRTPINQILGYSEMLQEEAVGEEQDRFVPDRRKNNPAPRNLLPLTNKTPAAVGGGKPVGGPPPAAPASVEAAAPPPPPPPPVAAAATPAPGAAVAPAAAS